MYQFSVEFEFITTEIQLNVKLSNYLGANTVVVKRDDSIKLPSIDIPKFLILKLSAKEAKTNRQDPSTEVAIYMRQKKAGA